MSFFLDPPLLVASGAAAEKLAGGEKRTVEVVRTLCVGSFIGVSLALYANIEMLSERWPTFGSRSGREFMLTSGLARIDEGAMRRRHHVAALSLFVLYPAWFELGRALAHRENHEIT